MADKHIVHCRNGGKVVIDGNRVEVHLPGPVIVHRKTWTKHFVPAEEVRRTLAFSDSNRPVEAMLEEAFQAVPQVVHYEDD